MTDHAALTDLLPDFSTSIPSRLGTVGTVVGGVLHGRLDVVPSVLVHGAVSATAVAYLVDIVAGMALDTDPDLWIFTSDMSVRIGSTATPTVVTGGPEIMRDGRRSGTVAVPMIDEQGRQFAWGIATFAKVARREGDPVKPMPDLSNLGELLGRVQPLETSVREAAGLRVLDPANGGVELDVTPNVVNPAGTLHGAMVAFVAECAAQELAESATGEPRCVTDLDLRYLKQIRGGTVRSAARSVGDSGAIVVDLFDMGSGDTLLTTVLARTGPPAS